VAFFLLLAALAGVAMTLLVLYDLRQQLRPEALAEAEKLWRECGPADYDLTFTTRSAPRVADEAEAQVQPRQGALDRGLPVDPDAPLLQFPARRTAEIGSGIWASRARQSRSDSVRPGTPSPAGEGKATSSTLQPPALWRDAPARGASAASFRSSRQA
jgi:hypothetical protein